MTKKEEFDEIYNKIKTAEQEGSKNILKYYDRIHDKLFSFNNILIAGYFALSQIYNSVSIYLILIPIVNLFILLLIEYRNMGHSRFEANVTKKTRKELNENGKNIFKTNFYSRFIIGTTSIVTIVFIVSLFAAKENEIKNSESKTNEIQHEFNKEDSVSYKNCLIGPWSDNSTKNATFSFYEDSVFYVDKFEYYKYEMDQNCIIFDYSGLLDTATILKLSKDSLIIERQTGIERYVKFDD
jgi:hypothetical protein